MDIGLEAAVEEARSGLEEGGIPIGSALVVDGAILGRGRNRRVQKGSAVLHAEMDAIENAGRLAPSVYRRATIYTTLSPCDMCSGAILLYGIPKVVIAENETFTGAESLLVRRGVELEVVGDERCIRMMERFIAERPDLWFEDIGEA
ncbi:MAG: nucleoside deaminase [Actinobacteria bacterium]|nr:nucleoside deaminase [Actinomycetota bacterium]